MPDRPQDLDAIEPIATDEVRAFVTVIKTAGEYDAIRPRSLAFDVDEPRRYATTAPGRATLATYDPFP